MPDPRSGRGWALGVQWQRQPYRADGMTTHHSAPREGQVSPDGAALVARDGNGKGLE